MSGLSKAACLGRLQLGVRAHRGFHCLVTSPLSTGTRVPDQLGLGELRRAARGEQARSAVVG